MQHIELGPDLAKYHAHLESDHDFRTWAEILTMEEKPVGEMDLLDGQINFTEASEGPEQTGSIVLSDPENALSFGAKFARDGKDVLWVNRLVRIMHETVVPTLGPITTVCMVGVPTAVARSGGELSLELADKSVLCDHGVRPHNFKRGMRVDRALRILLVDICGEKNVRIPTTKKKLKKPYKCGMGEDSLTPWQLAKRIAGTEMGWRLFFSSDGYATAEATSKSATLKVEHLLDLPQSSAPFSDFANYVKITSERKPTNRERKRRNIPDSVVKYIYQGIAVLPSSHDLSEQSLGRHGAMRTLPLVLQDSSLKSEKEVSDRTKSVLKQGSDLNAEQSYQIMPFFHLDKGDKFELPLGIGTVKYDKVSIPLGVGGNMEVGQVKWVSRPVKVKRSRTRTTVKKRNRGGGGGNG